MRVRVIEAGPDIFFVRGPRTNWCLLRGDGGVTLIDGAWPRDYRLVVDSLDQIGATPDHVLAVVLTHSHPDHIGVAERFRTDHGSTIHTHIEELPHAHGKRHERVRTVDLVFRLWRPSVLAFVAESIVHGGLSPKPAGEATGFNDGPLEVPGRPVPVPTPGHTSGHCSFHLPDHGLVITGDALVSENILTRAGGPQLTPQIFSHDPRQAEASLDNLAALDADQLLPGHGDPLHMSPADAVRAVRHRLADGG